MILSVLIAFVSVVFTATIVMIALILMNEAGLIILEDFAPWLTQ